MQKTYEQLEDELARELAYSQKTNSKIDRLREQLRNTISIQEHEKILSNLRREHENKMAEIKIRQPVVHNPRGAGRKKKATEQVVLRVKELRTAGFSQALTNPYWTCYHRTQKEIQAKVFEDIERSGA